MNTVSRTGLRCLPAIMLAAVCSLASANEHQHREHGAHQHGVAQLNVALQGDVLEIELLSPAMNIVGFEHKPENHQQGHQVAEALTTLSKGGQLFSMPAAAACVLEKADVDTGLREDDGRHEEHGHEAKAIQHEHEHEHEHEGHADFDAVYRFKCANPAALRYMDVQLFALFPATGEIHVQLVSAAGQQALELTPQSVRLPLQ